MVLQQQRPKQNKVFQPLHVWQLNVYRFWLISHNDLATSLENILRIFSV